jgi:hypothetical protein
MSSSLRIGLVGLALAGLIALPFACGEDPETNFDDDSSADDDAGDDTDTTPPVPPEVDDATSPTPLLVQTLTGRAEAGSLVAVTGGAREARVFADGVTGGFCVTVSLVMNTENVLFVTATDGRLNTSAATEVTIVQDMSLYPEERNGSLTGIASAASTSTTECIECTPDKANDDSLSTEWQNSTNGTRPEAFHTPQWLSIDLLEPYEISRAEILWGGEDYGTHYSLWYSNFPSPTPLHENLAEWTFAYEVGSGMGGTDVIDLSDPIRARHFALALVTSHHLNPIWNLYDFSVVEYRLFGVPVGEIPEDPGCQ